MTLRISALALFAALLLATAAHAVGTRYFSLDSASVLSDGKLEGTAVLSTGSVVASVQKRRIALNSTQVARSLLVMKDGSAFIGTGNDGKIWKLTGDVAKVVAETDAMVVSALAMDAAGTLYAGTLPKGKVFAVDKAGSAGAQAPVKARELIALPGAEHVAALAIDAKKKLLYAATGPEGKVFAIQLGAKAPKADVYYDGDASHIMSLALADDGSLYAGTSDEALLVRITAPGRAEVVYDFEGNELTALALQGTQIAVAVNTFPKVTTNAKKAESKDDKKSDDKTEAPKEEQKPGKGQLWVITTGARSRKLWTSDEGHITALQWADGSSSSIYAATGKEGQIHRIEPDGRSALWLDVDERQVLALDLHAPNPVFVTADAGAAYRVLPKGTGEAATWTSKVLDAQFLSRFGQLVFRGRGALKLQTRSGNTDKPNASWSEWSSAIEKPGPIRSPAARFLQIRATIDPIKDPASELYAVTAYYLPLNQPGQVTEVTAKPKVKDSSTDASSIYALEWKVDNPDGDRLRYRLSFRPEGEPNGRSILRESEILTKTTYDWQTESIPDGYYRVAVQASDELESPADGVLKTTLESEPFLVDNKQPSVEGLKLDQGKIRGVARDLPGPVTKLERAIDNGDYEPFYPSDDLLDTSEEPFSITLPKLEPGRHVISVRATDARNNRGTAELWFSVK